MAVDPAAQPIDAQVLGSTEVDEGVLRQLLRNAFALAFATGRTLVLPRMWALSCPQ